MSILITGIGGMVGSHLADRYLSCGQSCSGIYYNSTIDLEELPKSVQLNECDIRDAYAVLKIIRKFLPSKIYHLAAQSYPSVSWDRPADTLDINVIGTVNICEAVKLVKAECPEYDPVIVIACSSAEYGASLTEENVPIDENTALLPLHPYGVSKVAQDLLGYQYYHSDNLKTIRARIFNTTGPRKVGDAVSDFCRRAVSIELGRAVKLRVGNLNTRRAITDVRDLVSALMLLSDKGSPGDVYNISGEHVYEMNSIVGIIKNSISKKINIELDPSLFRPTDEAVIWGDSTKLKECTGWIQEYTLERTIHDMLQYWREKMRREY